MLNLSNISLLITGGTGSYGLKLLEILLTLFPDLKSVTVFSRDEYKQYEMQRQFPAAKYPALKFMIGDIRDQESLLHATKGIDIIIHAAALKQNISGEQYSDEFIKTNVDGTRNLIKAALQNDVKQVLSLSTDKAVYPTTLYGASKLCAEKLLLSANTDNSTSFSILRLGNLFGSRGSISSELKDRLSEDSITITDPEMTRFSLTLEASINMTLKVLKEMKGGEIFIPKMEAYRLGDLFHALNENIKIMCSGPRLTEKIHEIALSLEESRFSVEWDNFYIYIGPQSTYFAYWQHKGQPIPSDFEYTSVETKRLSQEELRILINTHTL